MPSEQELVRLFFTDHERGYFVEVGANEPRLRSQTWHLEQIGWTGALVEPQPDLVATLRKTRTAMIFEAACSSHKNAGQLLPLHVAGPLSSLERGTMAPGARPQGTIHVPIRTLDDILVEAGAPVGFDFLSIDVEGHELDVLSGIDLRHWKPKLILLEDHVPDLSRHRYMRRSGYRLVRRFDTNGWYVPKNATARPSTLEILEIIRKYYLALPFRKLRNSSRHIRYTIAEMFRRRSEGRDTSMDRPASY